MFQGAPKLYGALMVGDDNFLNLAAFNLNYEISYRQTQHKRIRCCGNCVSGLTIAKASKLIAKMDESVQNVIINVGSVDIAEGKQLIEMCYDLKDLLIICDHRGINPIITTLPPLPNHMLRNQKDILVGFNNFIRTEVAPEYAVIDLNLCMVHHNGCVNMQNFQPVYRHVSGSNQPFVLWNKLGRNRILEMLVKNLGQAIFNANYFGGYF